MKIGVNLTHLTSLNSGAKTYFINLFQSLLRIDIRNKYYFFLPKNIDFKELNFLKRKNTYLIYTKLPQQLNPGKLSIFRFIKIYLYFRKYFKQKKIDIFIHTSLPLISNPHGKTISNIFDIRYLDRDYETNFFKRLIYEFILKYCLKNSDYLFTISKFIKKEISNKFIIRNKKIKVFYCSIKKQKKIKKSNKNFILTVGHLEKRKNFLNLVKSFNILKKKYAYPGKLIIVSSNFTKDNTITRYLKNNHIEKFVLIKKNTTNAKLKYYYANTDLFIFPSIYEGFGLPILEALMQNSKILTSNISVFKEILGSKFTYFNPLSPKDISKKIYLCINKKKFLFNKKNNQLILNKFSSNKISNDYLKFLNEI